MKPAWDELTELYKDSPTYLIADVDCTTEGKPLCQANGVRGYPTILYGDPNDLQKYKGQRTIEGLKEHVEKVLKPLCSPFNADVCDDDQKAAMAKFQAMDAAALDAMLTTTETELAQTERAHNNMIKEAEATFKTVKDAKSADISMMKSIKAFAAKDGSGKDEL